MISKTVFAQYSLCITFKIKLKFLNIWHLSYPYYTKQPFRSIETFPCNACLYFHTWEKYQCFPKLSSVLISRNNLYSSLKRPLRSYSPGFWLSVCYSTDHATLSYHFTCWSLLRDCELPENRARSSSLYFQVPAPLSGL